MYRTVDDVVGYVEDDLVQCRRYSFLVCFAHPLVIVGVVADGEMFAMVVKPMMVIVLIVMIPWE